MKSYSQTGEDLFVLNYFGDYKGTLLEIGANNGIDLSNSKLLIENEWRAHLVEPGSISHKLFELYEFNPKVKIHYRGIGDKNGIFSFWESGSHVKNGNDYGLVSTCDFEETKRWPDVEFVEMEVPICDFNSFYNFANNDIFDFISIDAEGMDWQILKQIDLKKVGCKCLCIEFNSNPELKTLFTNYCAEFGMTLAHENCENLIFTI